jgi:hypothetical protein
MGSVGQDRHDKHRLVFWRRWFFTFSMGYEKMKVQRLDRCKDAQKLIPFISAGRLRAESTESFVHGSHLDIWWRCLRCSKVFTQSCRTGLFTTQGAFKTYRLFGAVEDLTLKEWWFTKGHETFGESITTLQVTLYVKRKNSDALEITVDAMQQVSSQLAGKEFGFWLDQICLLNSRQGLLSDAPLSWPIYRSRIALEAMSQLLSIMEIHEHIIRNAPQTCLWQIGEQLKLNSKAMTKGDDYPSVIADKHKAMGQTVSSYLKKGRCLVDNAANGLFPKY